jgi:hypothetical protein
MMSEEAIRKCLVAVPLCTRIDKQLETLLEKHGEWQQQKEEKEKKATKKT